MQNKSSNPIDVSLLGTATEMLDWNSAAYLIKQPNRRSRARINRRLVRAVGATKIDQDIELT